MSNVVIFNKHFPSIVKQIYDIISACMHAHDNEPKTNLANDSIRIILLGVIACEEEGDEASFGVVEGF